MEKEFASLILSYPNFDSCNAPLCPLDEEGLKKAVWYPDEEICRRRGLNYPWLKTQKKIAKRAKHSDRYLPSKCSPASAGYARG